MAVVEQTEHRTTITTEAPRRPRFTDRIGDNVSVAIAIMWVVGYLAVGALEPVSHAAVPTIAIVLSVAFYLGLAATAVGLGARRRWGIVASLGTALLFLGGVIACPATGHHQLGAWWLGQIVISVALVVGSAVALGLSGPAGSERSR